MKKLFFILLFLVTAKINSNAQSAVAIFKPLYSGDEHYSRVSSADSQAQAETKALDDLSAVVAQKLGSTANGRSFIYRSTSKKGYYCVGSGKDQYGHYLHYEAVLGYDNETNARQAVNERLAARGLYDREIVDEGEDN